MAPTLYAWVRFSGRVWPQRDLRTAMTKALVEQVTYGPFASATFFFAMTYLETRNTALARKEVAEKFLPTYKVFVRAFAVYFSLRVFNSRLECVIGQYCRRLTFR